MKTNGKLIAILLILALLVLCVGAYIILFRSEVSVERYLAQGDKAMDRGNYSRAVRSYESALKLAGSDGQISISLSNAYKADGNYTKAEYVLVQAITQDPEWPELYVALSRVYVEQEKFLDADELLSRAASETVREKLAAMRPAPPSLTPEAGYYSNYLSVSASCVAGRIYLSTDGDYPSNAEDLYTAPIALPAGETTVLALVVDDSGLVSPVNRSVYTIAGVIEPVTFTDTALDSAVRKLLGKSADDVLMSSELWGIEELTVDGGLRSLDQISYFIGLKKLDLTGASVADYAPLQKLPLLQTLDLSGCVLSTSNLQSIGHLLSLRELDLSSCALTSVDRLSTLKNLQTLDLSGNAITDVMSLTQMTALETLNLSNNPLASLQALQACSKLRTLILDNCSLTSLDALSGMTELTELDVSNNQLTTLEPLAGCTKLVRLLANNNKLTEILVLPKLTSLQEFAASHNKIKDIPAISNKNGCVLKSLELNYNEITGVGGLSGLVQLNYLQLDYNKVKDLSPLKDCRNLVEVDAWNNPLSTDGVSALTQHSIIVNYNPNYK